MKKLVRISGLVLFASMVSAADPAQFELENFRFSPHKGFERLVLQFKYGPKKPPELKLKHEGQAFTIEVDKANLVGAIPEAAINETSRLARFLGPVTIETEGGFNIGVALKGSGSKARAFWLENPHRLVIDASGESGNLASATHKPAPQSDSDAVAAEDEDTIAAKAVVPKARPVTKTDKRHWRKIKTEMFDKLWDVACYHTKSAVNPAVSFGPKKGNFVEEVPPYPDVPSVQDPDSVICFPRTSELTPLVIFRSPHEEDAEPKPLASGLMAPTDRQPGAEGAAKQPEAAEGAKPAEISGAAPAAEPAKQATQAVPAPAPVAALPPPVASVPPAQATAPKAPVTLVAPLPLAPTTPQATAPAALAPSAQAVAPTPQVAPKPVSKGILGAPSPGGPVSVAPQPGGEPKRELASLTPLTPLPSGSLLPPATANSPVITPPAPGSKPAASTGAIAGQKEATPQNPIPEVPRVLVPPPPAVVVVAPKPDPFKKPDPGVAKPVKEPKPAKALPPLF